MIADRFPWLTAIILLPLVASLIIPVLPDKDGKTVRWFALGVAIADFAFMCYAFWNHYDPSSATFQLAEQYAWVPTLGLSWAVSVDGISVPLVLLDEPTNTLDPTMRDQLLEQIREAKRQGKAVLFSSHVLQEVEAVCDRVVILRLGQLVHEHAMADLRDGRHVTATLTGPLTTSPPDGSTLNTNGLLDMEYRGPLTTLLEWLATDPFKARRHLARQRWGLRAFFWAQFGLVPRPALRALGEALAEACVFDAPLPDTS